MTQRMTAMGAAAVCAIVLAGVQIAVSAQTKTPAKAPAKAAAKAAPAKAAPAKTVAAKAVAPADPNSITLTGCLEADGRKFVLTDPEGAEAPKGRDWKTAFVTKRTKDVELTASSSVRLGDHLGHRVSIVGVRTGDDTQLQARSIKQLASSCS